MSLWSCLQLTKSVENKVLLDNLFLTISREAKIAIIGRNGLGKTTLLKIIAGQDTDFSGKIQKVKNLNAVLTKQEHNTIDESLTALDYILEDVPFYTNLKDIIKAYEKNPTSIKLETYCDAVEKFYMYDYYNIENKVLVSLNDFQINKEIALNPLISLSGGQKRFVELVKVMYSNAGLVLIDEPTNYMDYIGKEKFIYWLINTKQTVIVVTHDRDVLKIVQQIWDLKDRSIYVYNGNYDYYLKKNSHKTTHEINEYETKQKKMKKLKLQIQVAKIRKDTVQAKGGRIVLRKINSQRVNNARTAATKLYDRLEDRYKEMTKTAKPSFWIDKESLENFSEKVKTNYHKYKEKNIILEDQINQNSSDDPQNVITKINENVDNVNDTQILNVDQKLLLSIKDLSLGYTFPLFKNLNFNVHLKDKIFIKGRNGAGKTTLIKAIINTIYQKQLTSILYKGDIEINSGVKLGFYDQEIENSLIDISLQDAIKKIYEDQQIEIDNKLVSQILENYLFDLQNDRNVLVNNLSGGQKARLQIIKMFSNNPNLLILDEPTNHLDLPSIEVLENSLQNFSGAIIYITHDTYLQKALGGTIVEI